MISPDALEGFTPAVKILNVHVRILAVVSLFIDREETVGPPNDETPRGLGDCLDLRIALENYGHGSTVVNEFILVNGLAQKD